MRPFFLPGAYQGQANALPGMAARAPVAYAGGQNQDIAGPEQQQLTDIHAQFDTSRGRGSWGGYYVPGQGANPIEGMVSTYAAGTKTMPGDVARSQMLNFSGLGRVSGSMMREVRRSPSVHGALGSPIDPSAFGSDSGTLGLGATVYARVKNLTGRLGSVDRPWYENPWYLIPGAGAIVGMVWFLTRKKR
jgi:hypothetical protein